MSTERSDGGLTREGLDDLGVVRGGGDLASGGVLEAVLRLGE